MGVCEEVECLRRCGKGESARPLRERSVRDGLGRGREDL